MNKKTEKKFSWCPVCMIHTYHQKTNKDWYCLNPDHQALLLYRSDPWIKAYRKARIDNKIPAHSEV